LQYCLNSYFCIRYDSILTLIMKKIFSLLPTLMAIVCFSLPTTAQFPEWNDPNSLPKWMTPEEELRRDEIGRGFVPTQPPLAPVRNISEFNRMQGVLIRYPLGISTSLVAAMSEHAIVYSIVASQTIQNQAINAYTNAGVNMDNCEFIIAPTNSTGQGITARGSLQMATTKWASLIFHTTGRALRITLFRELLQTTLGLQDME
jgi:hypothetical protein